MNDCGWISSSQSPRRSTIARTASAASGLSGQLGATTAMRMASAYGWGRPFSAMAGAINACDACGDAGSCNGVSPHGGALLQCDASLHDGALAYDGGSSCDDASRRDGAWPFDADSQRHDAVHNGASHGPCCGGEYGALAQSAETAAEPGARRWAVASTAPQRAVRLAAEPDRAQPAAQVMVDQVRTAAQLQRY